MSKYKKSSNRLWKKELFHGKHKIRQFFLCLKWSKQRIIRGYADVDVWNMFNYIQTLLPEMFQTLKNTRCGSPDFLSENIANENGTIVNPKCGEEWDGILDEMTFLWRESDEETCSQKNPYEEEYYQRLKDFTEKYGLFGEKLETHEEAEDAKKRGVRTMHLMVNQPENKEFAEAYRAAERHLEEYRERCKNEALDMMKKYFWNLWD